MAWVESHEEIGDHWKTLQLSKQLNCSVPTAVGYVHLLWHYTLKVAWKDGDLSQHPIEAISRACWFTEDPSKLIKAMQESGFMDGMKVHEWQEYASQIIYQRIYNSERRKGRAKFPSKQQIYSCKKSVSTSATKPNQTLPNQTKPTTTESNAPYETPNFKKEPIKAIVHVYKLVKGFKADDRAWDKLYFPRYTKSAKELNDLFSGDTVEAMNCVESLGEYFSKKDLTWTMETIVKHAAEWRMKREQPRRDTNSPSVRVPSPRPRTENRSSQDGSLAPIGSILNTIGNRLNVPNIGGRNIGGTGTGDAKPVEPVREDPVEESESGREEP